MVENMFFLDSEHLEMVGIAPSPSRTHTHTHTHIHTHTHTHTFSNISIDGGKTSSSGGIPPIPNSIPVSLKTFLTCM